MLPRRQEIKQIALLKMLTYVLGVAPQEFGLVPNADGWVAVKELVKALNDEPDWRFVRKSNVLEAATRLAPQNLETDGQLVRASERRILERDFSADPPVHLYYGTRRRAWPVIQQRGLVAPKGGQLVLSSTPEEALKLGRRRDYEALLITVQARKALGQGVLFALLGRRLWLCDHLPANCLLGPLVQKDQTAQKPAKLHLSSPPPGLSVLEVMPGSFLLNITAAAKPYKRKGLKKDIEWKKKCRKEKRRNEK